MKLTQLKLGHKGIITGIEDSCNLKGRLEELGFVIKSEVIPLHKSLGGNITAYYIKGAVMAIRNEDASFIDVIEKVEDYE